LKSGLFGFLFIMWVLMLAGGGIAVKILESISISGFGEFDWFFESIIKAIVVIVLVVVWILILLKLKNWIFRKEIKS